ncbi:MAG: deoxyribose-phosphate aldolase, partial [Firmicutes bacterium]|nr:deoxyribose-phosphate aldolase [Bacillota bacterium]
MENIFTNSRDLARFIDHTLLKPEATQEQIAALCREAIENNFCSVCINPYWVPTVTKLLQGSPVKVCTVIGFPLGAATTRTKALEAEEAIAQGANEVDMVLNVGALKSGAYDLVLNDINAVVKSAQGKALVKVILETGLLSETEKIKACELSVAAGANFVKTSTGFGPGGATRADIALMRRTVGPEIGVKASGGVRDYDTAVTMIKAGASRIGTSSGI